LGAPLGAEREPKKAGDLPLRHAGASPPSPASPRRARSRAARSAMKPESKVFWAKPGHFARVRDAGLRPQAVQPRLASAAMSPDGSNPAACAASIGRRSAVGDFDGHGKGRAGRAVRDVPRPGERARKDPPGHISTEVPVSVCVRCHEAAKLRRISTMDVTVRSSGRRTRHAAQAWRETPSGGVRERTQRGAQGFPQGDAVRILHPMRGGPGEAILGRSSGRWRRRRKVSLRAPVSGCRSAAQRRRLGLSARQLLKAQRRRDAGGSRCAGCPICAWIGCGASRTRRFWRRARRAGPARLGGHRVHRYAFAGRGADLPVLLLHGLGGSADSDGHPGRAAASDLCPRRPARACPGTAVRAPPPGGPLAARELWPGW